jgi:hypothetical protein
MSPDPQYEAEMRAAADYVRRHPGCIQSNVIEQTMAGRSFGYARRRIKSAVTAGMIVERWQGNRLHMYPPGHDQAGGRR